MNERQSEERRRLRTNPLDTAFLSPASNVLVLRLLLSPSSREYENFGWGAGLQRFPFSTPSPGLPPSVAGTS